MVFGEYIDCDERCESILTEAVGTEARGDEVDVSKSVQSLGCDSGRDGIRREVTITNEPAKGATQNNNDCEQSRPE